MLRSFLLALGLFVATVVPADGQAPSRHIGIVLGWDVNCAMRADGKAITSCGLMLQEGNLKVLVGVDRSVSYTVSKDCGHPHNYWLRTGPIEGGGDLSFLLADVATAAQFDGKIRDDTCTKQSAPVAGAFENLKTALMMLRTFPASPENKGIWLN